MSLFEMSAAGRAGDRDGDDGPSAEAIPRRDPLVRKVIFHFATNKLQLIDKL